MADDDDQRPRLYLHVGSRKTGTSYLQQAVYASADALAEQGVGLPLPSRGRHQKVIDALRAIGDDGSIPRPSRKRLRAFARACDGAGTERLLVSHEDLAEMDATRAGALVAAAGERPAGPEQGVEVHLVITARDLRRQVPSEWQQSVKSRLLLPYEEYVRAVMERRPEGAQFWGRQDVLHIAARWAATLPPERVHVVTVPPVGSSPLLLGQRVGGLVGFDPAVLSSGRPVNTSLGAGQAELLRRLNVALGDRLTDVSGSYAKAVRVGISRRLLMRQPGPSLGFPARYEARLAEESARVVAGITDRGYKVVGDLDDLVSRPDGDEHDPAVFDDARVAEAAVEALVRVAVDGDPRRRKGRRGGADQDG